MRVMRHTYGPVRAQSPKTKTNGFHRVTGTDLRARLCLVLEILEDTRKLLQARDALSGM